VELVRTAAYSASLKRLRKLGASKADVRAMEDAIALTPEAGDVIPATGGLRKLRFGYGGRGKRGGGRTIYYALISDEIVYLLVAYAKADREDLTEIEKKLFVKLTKELTNG
jgi:hypothetical protein